MTINKIGGITTATGAHSGKSEHDKWAILEQMRMMDHKTNTRTGFRNSTGVSPEEYKRQAEEAKKQGFEAILQREMKKRS